MASQVMFPIFFQRDDVFFQLICWWSCGFQVLGDTCVHFTQILAAGWPCSLWDYETTRLRSEVTLRKADNYICQEKNHQNGDYSQMLLCITVLCILSSLAPKLHEPFQFLHSSFRVHFKMSRITCLLCSCKIYSYFSCYLFISNVPSDNFPNLYFSKHFKTYN